MAKVKVEKLSLTEVDALVAKIEGVPVLGFTPSSSWSHGGPVMEDNMILSTGVGLRSGSWTCSVSYATTGSSTGGTMLEAAMRCLVKHTFGDYVDVAKELA